MSEFFSGVGVILSLELRQRIRGVAWYVLLGIFAALIAIVTVLLSVALFGITERDPNGTVFSTIIYFVLLLGTLVAPALSGNAINGDRDAGTLATTQVTLITAWQLVIGKFLAAWVTALAFLAVAVPFLVFSAILGRMTAAAVLVSIVVLAVELGVVAAIGVGLSGILSRALFSIVTTYLVVAALSVGTLIAFALGGTVLHSTVTYSYSTSTTYDEQTGTGSNCGPPETSTFPAPRFDYFWGVLVANPYILLADAVPSQYTAKGAPTDLFGYVKVGIRSAQIPPKLHETHSDCAPESQDAAPTAQEVINSTVPGWFVGLLIHLVLAAAALVGAWTRTRTPTGRLSRGSRVA